MNKHNPARNRAAETGETSQGIIIRPYCSTELAGMYGVCRKTFVKWLHPFQPQLGKRVGRYYSSLQVQVIFDRLGTPYHVWEE